MPDTGCSRRGEGKAGACRCAEGVRGVDRARVRRVRLHMGEAESERSAPEGTLDGEKDRVARRRERESGSSRLPCVTKLGRQQGACVSRWSERKVGSRQCASEDQGETIGWGGKDVLQAAANCAITRRGWVGGSRDEGAPERTERRKRKRGRTKRKNTRHNKAAGPTGGAGSAIASGAYFWRHCKAARRKTPEHVIPPGWTARRRTLPPGSRGGKPVLPAQHIERSPKRGQTAPGGGADARGNFSRAKSFCDFTRAERQAPPPMKSNKLSRCEALHVWLVLALNLRQEQRRVERGGSRVRPRYKKEKKSRDRT
jgi:hypothetical protein